MSLVELLPEVGRAARKTKEPMPAELIDRMLEFVEPVKRMQDILIELEIYRMKDARLPPY